MSFVTKPLVVGSLTLTFLTGVGAAVAQQGAASRADAASSPRAVSGGQDVNLSSQEMLARVKTLIPTLEKMRESVGMQLKDAKDKKDVVKSLCLDDKLRQMKLATDTAKDRVIALNSAVSQNDADRSKHEFTVIQVLKERVQSLVAEAQQCIGEETGFIGNDSVIVEIDPAIPDGDQSEFPEDHLVSEPPLLSSPLM
jgi:hypothetical protein